MGGRVHPQLKAKAFCQHATPMPVVAVAVAVPSPIERAEHRKRRRGRRGPLSERSELWAVPRRREKRRGPAGVSPPARERLCFLFGYFDQPFGCCEALLCSSKEKVTRRSREAAGESFCSWASAGGRLWLWSPTRLNPRVRFRYPGYEIKQSQWQSQNMFRQRLRRLGELLFLCFC